jgi:hypothetical protein
MAQGDIDGTVRESPESDTEGVGGCLPVRGLQVAGNHACIGDDQSEDDEVLAGLMGRNLLRERHQVGAAAKAASQVLCSEQILGQSSLKTDISEGFAVRTRRAFLTSSPSRPIRMLTSPNADCPRAAVAPSPPWRSVCRSTPRSTRQTRPPASTDSRVETRSACRSVTWERPPDALRAWCPTQKDNYTRTTVYLATVLFLAGFGGHFGYGTA